MEDWRIYRLLAILLCIVVGLGIGVAHFLYYATHHGTL